jgi:hypothetical protein
MKCPQCGLINPDDAQVCDCGYSFEEKRFLTGWQEQQWRDKKWLLVLHRLFILLLVAEVAAVPVLLKAGVDPIFEELRLIFFTACAVLGTSTLRKRRK